MTTYHERKMHCPRLSGAGLVHRHDRFVFPSRAAIRAVELDLAGR